MKRKLALLTMSAVMLGGCSVLDKGKELISGEKEQPTEQTQDQKTEQKSEGVLKEDNSVGSWTNPTAFGKFNDHSFKYFTPDGSQHTGKRSIGLANLKTGDEVIQYLKEASDENIAPPAGMEYRMVDVVYEFREADSGSAGVLVLPDFNVFTTDGSPIKQIPNIIQKSGEKFGNVEVFPGGRATGSIVFLAPIGEEVILEFNDWVSDRIFFSTRAELNQEETPSETENQEEENEESNVSEGEEQNNSSENNETENNTESSEDVNP